MADRKIEKYIDERYQRWKDYARFHCELAKIPDEAGDVLNEVLISLLQKDQKKIMDLYERKKQGYRELDYYILKMIKLNAHSPTSPYRYSTRDLLKDDNTELWTLEVEDVTEETNDPVQEKLENFRRIRSILDKLRITEFEKEVFNWKFFGERSLNSWPGPENYPMVSKAYKRVKNLVARRIKNPYHDRREWTNDEIEYLRIEFPNVETIRIAGYLGRNYWSVVNMARRMGLKKTNEMLSEANRRRKLMNKAICHKSMK